MSPQRSGAAAPLVSCVRVWRGRRYGDAAAATFRHVRPFLLGTVPGAWDVRYGLPLRSRTLCSLMLHSTLANGTRVHLRRYRAQRTRAAPAT